MKIVICPDSFKGSLNSIEISEIIAEILKKEIPDLEEDLNLDLSFKINYVQPFDTSTCFLETNEHVLRIRPNGGTYVGKTRDIVYTMTEGSTQKISLPEREDYTFGGWEVVYPIEGGTYTLTGNEPKYNKDSLT